MESENNDPVNKEMIKNENLDDNISLCSYSQLCVSCQKEKATVICTLCVDSVATGAQLGNSLIPAVVNKSENNEKEVNNDSKESIESNVEKLMRNGNLVYCDDCFKISHDKMSSSHKPISIFQKQDQDKKVEIIENTTTIAKEDEKKQEPVDSGDTTSLIITDNDESSIKDSNELLQQNLTQIFDNIKCLTSRCEQFNEVKQSIRSMNDLIKDDLYMDFGSIAVMMKNKLDELSDKIKEKLKDSYSVVRDLQNKIIAKLNEIKDMAKQIEDQFKSNSNDKDLMNDLITKTKLVNDQIDQLNDDLKSICDNNSMAAAATNFGSILNTSAIGSYSLMLDSNLYPQFNYCVDTSKLIESINELNIQINHNNLINQNLFLNYGGENMDLNKLLFKNSNSNYDCLISSGIGTDGTFWTQLLTLDDLYTDVNNNNNLNLDTAGNTAKNDELNYKKNQQKIIYFIDEMNKYIRRKRITDRTWQTYAELKQKPEINDKCFCLESKSKKWLRAWIVSLDTINNTYNVRYMDTGSLDTINNYTLDYMIAWKDIEFTRMPPRALKCVFYKNDDEYEKDICLETKFLFRDYTARTNLKCSLIKTFTNDLDEQIWVIELFKSDYIRLLAQFNQDQNIDDEKNYTEVIKKQESKPKSINDLIIEYNENEKNMATSSLTRKNDANTDIRLETDCNLEQQNIVIRTAPVEENKEEKSNSSSFAQASNNNETVAETTAKFEELTNRKGDINNEASFSLDDPPKTELDQNTPIQKSTLNDMANNSNDYNELDIDDQTDDKRAFKYREGQCIMTSKIDSNGIFWIKPYHIPTQLQEQLEQLTEYMNNFVERTKFNSYGEMHLIPEQFRKCFVRYLHKNGQKVWKRGLIEYVNHSKETSRVRLLDNGYYKEASFYDIYPHRRLDHPINRVNYCAIRCCINRDSTYKYNNKIIKYMESFNSKGLLKFNLIEQCFIGKQKCWLTKLINEKDNLDINQIIEAMYHESLKFTRSNSFNKDLEKSKNEEDGDEESKRIVSFFRKNNHNSLDESRSSRKSRNKSESDTSSFSFGRTRSKSMDSKRNYTNKSQQDLSDNRCFATKSYIFTNSKLTKSDSNKSLNKTSENLEIELASNNNLYDNVKHEIKISTTDNDNGSNQNIANPNPTSPTNNFQRNHRNNYNQNQSPKQHYYNRFGQNNIRNFNDSNYDNNNSRSPKNTNNHRNNQTNNKNKNNSNKFGGGNCKNDSDKNYHRQFRRDDDDNDDFNNRGPGRNFNNSGSGYCSRYSSHNSNSRNQQNYNNNNNNNNNNRYYNQHASSPNNENDIGFEIPEEIAEDEVFLNEEENENFNRNIKETNKKNDSSSNSSSSGEKTVSDFTNIYIKNLDEIQDKKEQPDQGDNTSSCSSPSFYYYQPNDSKEFKDLFESNSNYLINNKRKNVIPPNNEVEYEEIEKNRGLIQQPYSDLVDISNTITINNKMKHNQLIIDESITTESVLNNNNCVSSTLDTTQQVANRHAAAVLIQPFQRKNFKYMSTDSQNAMINSNLTQNTKPRSYSDDIYCINSSSSKYRNILADEDEVELEMINDERINKKFIIPSSSNSSVSSIKKAAEEDIENESYASCAEEIIRSSNNSSITEQQQKEKEKEKETILNRNDLIFKNVGIELTFDQNIGSSSTTSTMQVVSLIDDNQNKVKNHQSELISQNDLYTANKSKLDDDFSTNLFKNSLSMRMEKMKNFTISVFVESMDESSRDSTTSSSSSDDNKTLNNSSANSSTNSSPHKVLNPYKLASKSMDFLDSTNTCKKSSLTPVTPFNPSQILETKSFDLNMINETDKVNQYLNSLNEFELNEMKLNNKLSSLTKTSPVISSFQASKLLNNDDDVFIYDSNPNNYVNINEDSYTKLVSKPPLIPNTSLNNNSNNSSPQHHQNLISNNNNSNNCLSTITECSNETFETCSNQSSNKNNINQRKNSNNSNEESKKHMITEDHEELMWNFSHGSGSTQRNLESPTIINNINSTLDVIDHTNVTFRRGDARSVSSSTSSTKRPRDNIDGPNNRSRKESLNISNAANNNNNINSNNEDRIVESKKDLKNILEEFCKKNEENNTKYQNQYTKVSLHTTDTPHQVTISTQENNEQLLRIDISILDQKLKNDKSSSSFSDSCFSSPSASNGSNNQNQLDSKCSQHTASSQQITQIAVNPNKVDNSLIINRKSQLISALAGDNKKQDNDKYESAILTDRLFEKFCLISNDDIMNNNNDENLSLDSLDGDGGSKKFSKKSSINEIIDLIDDQDDEVFLKSTSNTLKTNTNLQGPTSASTPLSQNQIQLINQSKNTSRINSTNNKIRSNSNSISLGDSAVPNNINNMTKSSSTSTVSSSNSLNNKNESINNPINQNSKIVILKDNPNRSFINKLNPNASTATTLEISSYTSDSLFNSQLMITPLCTDGAISHSLLQSSVSPSKSIIALFPTSGNNIAQNIKMSKHSSKSSIDLFEMQTDMFKQYLKQHQQSPTLPPLPSPPAIFLQQSQSIQSPVSLSCSTLPPPPPPPPLLISNNQEESVSLFPPPPSNIEQPSTNNKLNKSNEQLQITKINKPPSNKSEKQTSKNINIAQGNTANLIESLAARLNLSSSDLTRSNTQSKSNKNCNKYLRSNSLTNTSSSSSNQSFINSKIPNGNTNGITALLQSHSVNSSMSSNNQHNQNENKISSSSVCKFAQFENYLKLINKNKQENEINNSTPKNENMIINENNAKLTPSKVNNSGKNKWKEANFSLYGLDDDENEPKNNDLHTSNSNRRSKSYEPTERKKIFPNISGIDYDFDNNNNNVEKISNENQVSPLQQQDSVSFPPPPSQYRDVSHPIENENENKNLTPNQTLSSLNDIHSCNSFPPLPPQVLLSPTKNQLSDPQQQQIQSMTTTSSSATTVIPNKIYPSIEKKQVTPPNINLNQEEKANTSCPNIFSNQEEDEEVHRSFKLDHLIDINPKRFFINSKFRCKIHDVIDENGQFWLEVIYPNEDELKFYEIFKLFRLSSRINEAPQKIFLNKRISALYKNEWYRAIIIDDRLNENLDYDADYLEKCKVRFVDLGITKTLDTQKELRDIDQKFFNCPAKSVRCSIVIDETQNNQFNNKINNKLILSRDARKIFTKLIYKKILYAKVIELASENSDYLNERSESVCKIKLGYQTQRGIIDIYMYLLSKFYRDRYEKLKVLQPKPNIHSSLANIISNFGNDNNDETESDSQASTVISNQQKPIAEENEEVLNYYESNLSLNHNMQNMNEVVDENYYLEENHINDEDNQHDYANVNIQDEDDQDYEIDYEEYESEEETDDYELFSELMNEEGLNLNIKSNQLNEISENDPSVYYSVNNEIELENHDDNLDYTPVKLNESVERSRKKYNYTGLLKIDPVNLPSLNNSIQNQNDLNNLYSTPRVIQSQYCNTNRSTLKVGNRNRIVYPNESSYLTPYPHFMNNKNHQFNNNQNNNNNNNYSSDTDTSIQANCCKMPLKFRWNSSGSNKYHYRPSTYTNKTNDENFLNCDSETFNKHKMKNTQNININMNKKVKFHLK